MKIPEFNRSHGFSLLELLVAISIFSTISTFVFLVMDQYFVTQGKVNKHNEKLSGMSRFLQLIEQDIQYAINREIRDQYGVRQPALVLYQGYDNEFLTLTVSRPDYSFQGVTKLFRISWKFENGNIIRSHWPVLDRSPDSQPIQHVILEEVRDIRLTVDPHPAVAGGEKEIKNGYGMSLSVIRQDGTNIYRQIRTQSAFR